MSSSSSPYLSRPQISHPYPPSYRSDLSPQPSNQSLSPSPTPSPQPLHSSPSLPPSQSYAFDYQRRRDERHGFGAGTGTGFGTGTTGLTSNPPLYASPNPSYSAQLGPGPSVPMMGRDHRSGSESSMGHDGMGRAKAGYPEGWTKEDEEAEREFLSRGMIDWDQMKSWRYWIRKEWWYYYLIGGLIVVLVVLMSVYHDQIVTWLTPAANWMKALPAGWVIPIAILFVISFPPLFGHEIVTILIGVIWGLWIGFGITAAGTLLGEIGNFYAFKYCCRSRAAKLESKNLNYACMSHVVREGGFFIIFVARLSAIPGHFTTAVFSTCGMNIWIFTLACILTLPKQLIVVYLGVVFEAGKKTTKDRIISDSVLGVGFVITILSAWYIYREMNKARIVVWRRQRMALAAQGVSLDPVTGAKRASYKEFPEGGMDDPDARSPILRNHQSYQNPYDISYRRDDEMSVYQVEPASEQDIGYGFRPDQRQPPSSQQGIASFPQAHPAAGLRRDNSLAPTVYAQDGPPSPAEFPVASPAYPPALVPGAVAGAGAGVRTQTFAPPSDGYGASYAAGPQHAGYDRSGGHGTVQGYDDRSYPPGAASGAGGYAAYGGARAGYHAQ
ncbi:Tlg2-vesicle protein [Saitozyma podzolica]|uniref:Golgi apparatus membrane protein TVP38 n=1 Tax=Saitozyma podzolica TaxID=1890683 RepID=A0A427YIA8_9TREE|nr:Tlg2-vesicle protein [Saitozyma podzolica]